MSSYNRWYPNEDRWVFVNVRKMTSSMLWMFANIRYSSSGARSRRPRASFVAEDRVYGLLFCGKCESSVAGKEQNSTHLH